MSATGIGEVSLVIPMLDEALVLPRLIRVLATLDPVPAEIIAVDGGSADDSVALVRAAGWRLIVTERGRSVQINAGVAAAAAPVVCVLHADTIPPDDMVAVIARTMDDGTHGARRLYPAAHRAGRHALGDERAQLDQDLVRAAVAASRTCSCAACGCCSATTRCSSDASSSWRSVAATNGRW